MSFKIGLVALLLLAVATPAASQTCPVNNPRVAPDSRYTVSEPAMGQRVVQDLRTGLMWKQCVQGRSGASCTTGTAATHTWTQALVVASDENFAGHDDWRLPSINELRSLVESGCHSPAINSMVFPATASSIIWSSTTPRALSFAWIVSFDFGILVTEGKTTPRQVRLVRGGQQLDSFNSGLDFTPDPFSFATQVDVPQSEPRVSNVITLAGLTTRTGIQIAGAPGSQYRINGGAWTTTPGNVGNGDTVEIRHTSAAAPAAQVTSALTIGGVAATFSSSTVGYSPPQRKLNDTAQITCYNATISTGTVAPATPDPETTGFDEQDCTRGAAAADALGIMVKTGGSTAPGRDYTKIANDGSGLPDNATLGNGPGDWACTRDNQTGLVWEVKVNDATQLRDSNHAYTWFDGDSSLNGGIPGTLGSSSTCNATLPNCNTSALRDAVNALPGGLCNANDWRLPTPQELQSLVDFGVAAGPTIDSSWFPNTISWHYASGLTYAPDASNAWTVYFVVGLTDVQPKNGPIQVRLVRRGL
jgi:hypothetical protein